MSECALNVIIEMRDCMCLNALYMILLNESFYVSEFALYDIIKMRAGMCLNALCMIILKWGLACV